MKIAVIGNGPLAVEAAVEFTYEGADVRLIGRGLPVSKIHYMAVHYPDLAINSKDYIRPLSAEIIDLKDPVGTYAELWEKYYIPLLGVLKGRCYQREVLRVQKRFLSQSEEIEGHGRLYDLFRVTSALNPSGMVEEQLKENPELKDKLGSDILDSLKNQVESFEDFDLVFDTRGNSQQALPLGAGENWALNEEAVSKMGGVFYGRDVFENWDVIEKYNSLTLVGEGKEAALALLQLQGWLEDPKHTLNIVSDSSRTFANFIESNEADELKVKLQSLVKEKMELWRSNCIRIEEEIKQWRELDDHVKVKVPCPQFTEPQLRLYEGYRVTSCDKLIDQNQLYLTLELPPWLNPDDKKKELVTLGQDCVLALKGSRESFDVVGRRDYNEPGYFKLFSSETLKPEDGFEWLKEARKQVFNFFSKA